jgi:antagonist of KipI
MSLRVLEPGLQTLVVDFGRPHCRSLGLPVGGAADRTSLALGNALVGNAPDAAGLEFCLAGPVLEAQCELACVVYGAPFTLRSRRQQLRVGKTFTLQAGEVLEVGSTAEDMRAYLCVAGGLEQKVILGSRSGLEPVRKDALLPCRLGRIPQRFARIEWEWYRGYFEMRQWVATLPSLEQLDYWSPKPPILRILDGPQTDWFPNIHLPTVQEYSRPGLKVSRSSNRMGIRLECDPPIAIPNRELVSEPVCPGSVQVTPDGQCIILGVDGQTIGGYPKIAQVISADLDWLGQLRPGQAVYFQRVTLDEAERLYHAKQRELHHWVVRMQTSLAGIPYKLTAV